MRLIDGDALMKRLGIAYDCRECDQNKSPYCTWKPDVVDVCQIIADAPTIEPERPKGHWIIDGHHIQCSVCAERMCNTDREGDPIPRFFCPNCGAEMEMIT